MTAFSSPVDIANRALQHIGRLRISSLTEPTAQAQEINACYDRLRLAELMRNRWAFATRRTTIRSITATTQLFVPTAWASGTTYAPFQIVSYNGYYWVCQVASSNGHQPDISTDWDHYFGPRTADTFNASNSYNVGEIVIDANTNVYAAQQNGLQTEPTVDTTNWVQVGTTANYSQYRVVWPLGVGFAADNTTLNAFRLPDGWLRSQPLDPRGQDVPWLGAPVWGSVPTDWTYEGGLLISRDAEPIIIRFIADVWNVAYYHPLFCEGLAAKIAAEVCGPLTGETAKCEYAEKMYMKTMGEAREVDAIIQGPIDQPLDEYIAVRL